MKPGSIVLIESPSGMSRYHYLLLGNGRIKRTKYEGDMQGRDGDWNRRPSETIDFAEAQAQYRRLCGEGWRRI